MVPVRGFGCWESGPQLRVKFWVRLSWLRPPGLCRREAETRLGRSRPVTVPDPCGSPALGLAGRLGRGHHTTSRQKRRERQK